jgi:glucose/arabinose dehydrogenase
MRRALAIVVAACSGALAAAADPGAPLHFAKLAPVLPGTTYVAARPGDDRLFLVNRGGVVKLVENGAMLETPFLDLTDRVDTEGEGGLLSMAFDPDYATNGRFYVYYTTDTDGNPQTPGDLTARVSRFAAIGDPATAVSADAEHETVLLFVDKPTPEHNGGTVAMRDGWLYFAIGDGGGTGDPLDAAQNPVVPLGKMFRFDLSQATPVAQPWAQGFRNPFRFSFDSATGDLYVGDVGLESWEEIDVEPASSTGGRNYGWDVKEGAHCYDDPDGADPTEPACDSPALIDPVFEYPHDGSSFCFSVTGGAVYRGVALPDQAGRYFFSDFCTAKVRSFVWDGANGTDGPVLDHPVVTDAGAFTAIVAIVEDGDGELLFADYDGDLFRLVPEPAAAALGAAALLAISSLLPPSRPIASAAEDRPCA